MSKSSAPRKRIYAFCMVPIVIVAVVLLIVAPAPRRGLLAVSSPSLTSQPRPVTPDARERLQATFAALPLAFEQNRGQSDPQVQYMARGEGYKVYLTTGEAVLTLQKGRGDSEVRRMMMDRRIGPAGVKRMFQRRAQESPRGAVAAVHMHMLGANPGTQLAAAAPQSAKMNYFVGNDPSRWYSDVPLYGQVSYRNLYPGIDLAFHGNHKQLEFDYLVSPGANTQAIALGFQGAERITTSAAGDLVLSTSAGPIQMHRPLAYQEKDGARQKVDVRFVVSANEVTFALGSYDHSRQLVIDPTVTYTYSTYFGGSLDDYGLGITVDANGNEYVAGATDSDAIPGWSTATDGGFDVFVTEINSAGVLQFTTEFGGSSDDFPGGIAVDSTGIYVAGTTDSSNFPVTAGAAQGTFVGGGVHGSNDAFAAKLALNGSSITWATYINGSDSTSGLALAADSSQNVYVVGETFAPNLGGATGGVNPLPSGSAINLGSGSGDDDGYIVKLNSTGTTYLLVSYIGGSGPDLATGVALDGSGNIYVSGETISTDLPVTSGVVQPQCGTDGTCNAGASGPLDDAFIAAIKADLSNYTYLTYYGGDNTDDALAIAVDSSGDAFITGRTKSADFPLGSIGTPYQKSLAGAQNAFVVELNPSGSAATYGTYLGGNGTDIGLGIVLDSSDNVYVTGQTSSSLFPTTVNATQSALAGSTDAFVSVLSPSPGPALFSTYLGGSGHEDQLSGSIALDASQNIYVTGDTDSGNDSTTAFPTMSALDGTYGGGTCGNPGVPCTDAFITAYSSVSSLTPGFTIAASSLSAVAQGGSTTSTITISEVNGYTGTVNFTCSVASVSGGTPLPTCSIPSPVTNGAGTSTLTVNTTGAAAALNRPSSFFYALWLPIAGLSLVGMSFSSARSRRKKILGFLMVLMVMAALFLMPACGSGSSSGGGGGGCTGCTPQGNYTVTVTGTDSVNAKLTHSVSPALTLTVN